MNKLFKFLILTGFIFNLNGQMLKKVELVAEGRVEWQFLLPLAENGIVLVYKNEITKASVVRFDKDLNEVWRSEFFIDTESGPKAYSIDKGNISMMFSENNGAYYQVYNVDLSNGKTADFGFEIKEYFQDQDYVLLNDGVLMGGANEKGTSFYKYNHIDGYGEQIGSSLVGISKVQSFVKDSLTGNIHAVFNLQKTAPIDTKSKKKTAPVVISSEIVLAKISKEGQILSTQVISPQSGNNPLTAKVKYVKADELIISGTYRNPNGQTGVYIARVVDDKPEFVKYYQYAEILKANSKLTSEQANILIKDFQYLQHDIEYDGDLITVAGEFFRPEYKTVIDRVQSNSPYGTNQGYGGYGYNDPYGMQNQRTQSRQVFAGYRFLNGVVYSFDNSGALVSKHAIPIEKISGSVSESFAFTANKSVALVQKGNLIINNLEDPGINTQYTLASNSSENKFLQPQYSTIKAWYSNFFIGMGFKNEASFQKINPEELPEKKKKAKILNKKTSNQPAQELKQKRYIYLTKIAS